jgi:hypothetical protein
MEMNVLKTCVVSLGVGGKYPQALREMGASLCAVGWGGNTMFWEEYPPDCPTHEDVPYGFKSFVIGEAIRHGYKNILWVDAGVRFVRPLTALFDYIDQNGYALWSNGEWNIGQWTSDRCLELMGVSREESFAIPDIVAGCMGFNTQNLQAMNMLSQFQAAVDGEEALRGPYTNDDPTLCSMDGRVLGHRHDQSVLSLIRHRLSMALLKPPLYYNPNRNRSDPRTIIIQHGNKERF